MISFVVVIFYVLTIGGIFILRKRLPDAERPYKAFGYPILPALYIALATAISVILLIVKPTTCGWGVAIMLAGIPVYFLTRPKPAP